MNSVDKTTATSLVREQLPYNDCTNDVLIRTVLEGRMEVKKT